MRLFALSIGLICAATRCAAFEVEDRARFGPTDATVELKLLSTADTAYFAPMIDSFLAQNPELAVDYTVASSTEVMRAIYEEGAAFDLVISSAMDLQTKLANDGFAQAYTPNASVALPDWAVWNEMVFAFTQEPAAIVISNTAFAGLDVPRDRQTLLTVLRSNPDQFRGKVGTYDIRSSGLGYLFATQDARASETFWRLTEVMGALEATLYCCSSAMIDAVESGELAVAYNVLSSYAAARENSGAYTIILPSDFATVMQRTVLIPRDAPALPEAQAFVDHMMRRAFGTGGSFDDGPAMLADRSEASLHRIRLGPGLLVFLDQLKKRAFLQEWQNAILQ